MSHDWHESVAYDTAQVTIEADEGRGSTSGSNSVEMSDIILPAGLQYRLRTHTLRRYGLNDAFDRSITLLLHQQV